MYHAILFLPLIGALFAGLFGRFVGARDMARVNEVMTAAFVVALAYGFLLATLYITYRFPLVEVFAPPSGDFSASAPAVAFTMLSAPAP